MGRSTYCFKILTCAGGDSAHRDDDVLPQDLENKNSGDKRGWSFRKRSARHRVLSNTIIAEAPYSANKESYEPANLNIHPADSSNVSEKISVIHCTDEKPQVLSADPKVSETVVVTKDESEVHVQLDESVIVVVQAAVRGFLAQKELSKLKSLVKLQAAVRGHLVRQHAVGTLRCVQAIVKMQALVRARRTHLLHEKREENSLEKRSVTNTPIKKLLNNAFARQLIESTPKERPTRIKCDLSKPDSAWSWLERWMSVSSGESTPQTKLTNEQLERERKEHLATLLETALPSEGSSELEDTKSNLKETAPPSDNKEIPIAYDVDDFKFNAYHPTSFFEQSMFEKTSKSDAKESSEDANSCPSETLPSNINSQLQVKQEPPIDINSVPIPGQTVQSDVNSQMQVSVQEPPVDINSLPIPGQTTQSDVNSQMQVSVPSGEAEIDGDQTHQPQRSMKRNAPEQLETEGKKFVCGSRKASNSAFIAAQSKFEELSATTNSNRPISSSYEDSGAELIMDTFAHGETTVVRTKELNIVEDSIPNNFRAHCGDSECGTELSVTSTLDSPDRSEVGAVDNEHEAKSSDKEACTPEITKDDVKSKNESADPPLDLSEPVAIRPEKIENVRGESVDSIEVADKSNIELKPETSASDVPVEPDSGIAGPTGRSSPEASPRSHVTVPESQGTPPSQISLKAKKGKTDKSASNQKRKSLSSGKRSSNSNADADARGNVEQQSKDQTNGKRRNSCGSTRPDQADQEPMDSSSSSSLPHFMQATESARAKIQANSSPRSSPDIQDRDFVKKRHSLPGSNGRQGSPRVQRSISQAQPSTKGNGNNVIHEKKWLR